jgi:uncharacterized damage-inducible protein DinB
MTVPASYGLRNLRMLVRYTQWADAKLFAALRALPDGTPGAAGRGFGSMLSTLNHSLVVDEIWRAHLEAKPHGHSSRNTPVLPTLDELEQKQANMDTWFIDYADALTESQGGEMIHFKFVDGGPGEMTRGDMLLHVINHKTYHRGFVSEMIFQLPIRAPMIDLPVYLRDAAPRLAA